LLCASKTYGNPFYQSVLKPKKTLEITANYSQATDEPIIHQLRNADFYGEISSLEPAKAYANGASTERAKVDLGQRWIKDDLPVMCWFCLSTPPILTTNSSFSDLMFQWFTLARMIVADVTSVSSFTVELSSVPTKTFKKSAKTMSPEQPSRRLVHF